MAKKMTQGLRGLRSIDGDWMNAITENARGAGEGPPPTTIPIVEETPPSAKKDPAKTQRPEKNLTQGADAAELNDEWPIVATSFRVTEEQFRAIKIAAVMESGTTRPDGSKVIRSVLQTWLDDGQPEIDIDGKECDVRTVTYRVTKAQLKAIQLSAIRRSTPRGKVNSSHILRALLINWMEAQPEEIRY